MIPYLRFEFPHATAPSPHMLKDMMGEQGNRIRSGSSAPQDEAGPILTFSRPERLVIAHNLSEVLPALNEIEQGVDAGFYAAGFLSYEAGWALAAAGVTPEIPDPSDHLSFQIPFQTLTQIPFNVQSHSSFANDFPLLWFGLFRSPDSSPTMPSHLTGEFQRSEWIPMTSPERYRSDIASIREAIANGETYQVNYTLRLRAQLSGNDYAYYRRLVAAQRPGYAAYLDIGRYRILSASPELFFHRRGEHIVTRPMKGTRRRAELQGEDRGLAEELRTSPKDRAENIMIVDLLRNDLGRLALPGTVRVSQLFAIEPYPTVWQMTSTIEAQLARSPSLSTLLEALFPCGSITGAPKINTMRHIARLESHPRHIYCGAIGFLTPNADPCQREAMFNVAIRTLLLDTHTETAEYGVGGGITWDSHSADEYAEALSKARILES